MDRLARPSPLNADRILRRELLRPLPPRTGDLGVGDVLDDGPHRFASLTPRNTRKPMNELVALATSPRPREARSTGGLAPYLDEPFTTMEVSNRVGSVTVAPAYA